MPLYEYRCQQCNRHTEKRQKFSDVEITECPHCGGHLERVISAPNIAFKGGGWYKDLYSSPKPASGGESKDNAASPDTAAKPAATGGEASHAPASGTTAPASPGTTPAPATPASPTKN